MLLPDLVGMKLNKVLEILDSCGIKETKIILTSPPREEKNIDGDMRVIRLENNDSGIVKLLVCR